ncbi:MAG: hypothetical protein ACF8PN_03700 [Phycisphaerales bacterium]
MNSIRTHRSIHDFATPLGTVLAAAGTLILAMGSTMQPAKKTADTRSANELLPLNETRKSFKILAGENEGEYRDMTLERRDGETEQWILTMDSLYRMRLHRAESGEIMCDRLDLVSEDKATRYDPPIRLIPASVRAAETTTSKGRAEVIDLETGKVSRTGRYTHALRKVSHVRLDVPAAEVEGYLLEFDHEIDLDMATLTIDLELGSTVGEGEGLVYWRSKSTIEKVGLFGDTTIQALGAAEFDEGGGSSDR